MENILLVNSKTGFWEDYNKGGKLPLALLSIGTPLHHEGYKVKILDQRTTKKEDFDKLLKKEINKNPLFVGLTSMTGQQISFSLDISKKIKFLLFIYFVLSTCVPSFIRTYGINYKVGTIWTSPTSAFEGDKIKVFGEGFNSSLQLQINYDYVHAEDWIYPEGSFLLITTDSFGNFPPNIELPVPVLEFEGEFTTINIKVGENLIEGGLTSTTLTVYKKQEEHDLEIKLFFD